METIVINTLEFLKGQSIQVAIVFAAVLILTWLLQNKSAHVRYLLWLLVAIKCLTPPLVIFSVPVLPAETIPVILPSQNSTIEHQQAPIIIEQPKSTETLTVVDKPQQALPVSIENLSPRDRTSKIYPQGIVNPLTSTGVLLSAWAVGAACYLLWALGKAVRLGMCLRRIRKPLPAQLMIEQIEMLARLWNYPGGFNVWLVDGINQPFVWGLWRGAIYLPTRFQSIEGDKQKAIVLHEMAHVVRFDAFVNLIQILIQGVFWFHPLVWLANKAIRQEREKCCDEIAVARLGTAPKEYGHAIVETLLQEAKAGLAIPTLAVAGPVKNIEDRIKTIMQPGRRFFQRPSIVALLIIGCLAALVVPTTIALTQKVTPPDFVLSGIVTDANDRPIAGAIVFDDGYGPEPYQKGITDKTGKFEYKSWNEEHNVTAKADGYQQQMMVFTTAPFDNSKNLNFKLLSERNELKVSEAINIPHMDIQKRPYVITVQASKSEQVHDVKQLEEILKKEAPSDVVMFQFGEEPQEIPTVRFSVYDAANKDKIVDSIKNNLKLVLVSANPAYTLIFRAADLSITDGGDLLKLLNSHRVSVNTYRYHSMTVANRMTGIISVSTQQEKDRLAAMIQNRGNGLELLSVLGPEELKTSDASNPGSMGAFIPATSSPFTATLPNGVTVELLGICEHPSEGKSWWKPDGSELKDKPWNKKGNSVSARWGRKAYEIALKLNWSKNNTPGFYVDIDNVSSSCFGGRNQSPTSDLRYEIVELPKDIETTDIHFAVASGSWQTHATQQSPWQGVYVSGVVWQSPIAQGNKTILSVAHNFTGDEYRLVAIDKNGKEIVGYGNSGSIDKNTTNMQMTFNIKLDNIKEFRLQTRPYEHYTFKNVSLRPGQKTDVKIETQKSETGIDFVPADLDLQFDSTRGVCFVVVSIPNRGKTVLPKMKLRFYRGDPKDNLDEAGGPQQGWHEAGPIEPGKTWNERTADFHLTDGQYEFNAILDYDNTVAETDETNNAITLQIKIVNGQIAEKNVSLKPGKKTDSKLELPPAIVKEGIGFDDIVVGSEKCSREFICSRLGKPENDHESWLVYQKQYGMDFWLNPPRKVLTEIRLNQGFKGKLPSSISIASTKQQVFEVYGQPVQEKAETNIVNKYGGNRVLLTETINREKIGKLYYDDLGLLFWFKNDSINQIMISQKSATSSPFTAVLPNGVTVELVGLGTAPWKTEQQWWKPDGTNLNPPALTFPHLFEWKDQPNGLQFACTALCKFSNYAGKELTVPEVKFSNEEMLMRVWGTDFTADGYEMTYIASNPYFETVPEKTDMRLAVASKEFSQAKRIGNYTPKQHQTYSLERNRDWVILHPVRIGQTETPCVDLTCKQENKDIEFRVFAKLKNGQTERWHGGGVGKEVLFFQSTPKAQKLSIEDIEDIIIEYRPYEWITFKNVSLKPGQKTEAKMETSAAKIEGAAAGPNETGISAIQKIKLSGDDVVQVEANAGQGFNFPFYLFIPKGIDTHQPVYVLVETNNTGTATDDFEFHRQKAQQLVKESYANRMARSLEVPLLVPVFPRPKENWQVYTHALDRDSLEIKEGQLQRIDLQLAAMIKYARDLLHTNGIKTQDRVFMDGFSASAKFCNHFAFLHPEMVKAVASGGVNGIPTLPVSRWNGYDLPFPIGIADLKDFTGQPFNEKAYRLVSQYIYMGYLDRNDTVPSRDAWSEEEATLIKKAVAEKMMPDRWEVTQKIYREQQIPAQLVTYNGVGHTIKDEMLDDVVKFFRANSGDTFVPIEPHVYPFVEYGEIHEAHVNGVYWQGDKSLPEFVRKDQSGDFNVLIGIEEWFKGQDHRQLDEFVKNAGFKFVLKADGQKDILIDKNNYHGNCSMGDGKFQAFYVNLDEDLLMTMVTGVPYTLQPLNSSDKYVWTVNNGVTLLKPKNEEATVNSAAQKEFKTTLSDGVMVELVGICEYPSKGKQWWQPDGSPLSMEITTQDNSRYQNKYKPFEFAYRVVIPEGITLGWPKTSGSTSQSGLVVLNHPELEACRVHLDVWGNTTKISFPIAAGPWKTLGTTNGKGQTNVSVGNRKLMFSTAVGNVETLSMTVSDDLERFDDYRLIAFDKQGKLYPGNRNWFSVDNMRQSTFTFTGLDPESVDRYEFQTRPFEDIVFKNVSLKPGKKTDVKIEIPEKLKSIATQSAVAD